MFTCARSSIEFPYKPESSSLMSAEEAAMTPLAAIPWSMVNWTTSSISATSTEMSAALPEREAIRRRSLAVLSELHRKLRDSPEVIPIDAQWMVTRTFDDRLCLKLQCKNDYWTFVAVASLDFLMRSLEVCSLKMGRKPICKSIS